MKPQRDERRAACARIVAGVLEGRSLEPVLEAALADLPQAARGFVREVSCGTLRHLRLLEATLAPYLRRPLRPRHRLARCLLLSACYQLSCMHEPAHAVVDDSVRSCADLRCPELRGLVNAVLRGFVRSGARLPDAALPDAVRYSYPDFLYGLLCAALPEDELRQVLEQGNERPPMFLRVENSRLSTQSYVERLQRAGLTGHTVPGAPAAVRLEHPCPAAELPGFAEGLVSIQDLSAQLAAPLLPLQGAHAVLDCCSAPGGKSAHLLDLHPQLELWCCDVSAERLELTRRNLQRLGRTAHLEVCDGRQAAELGRTFDAVLVDAPCSGTGVIRRHPDLKWLRRAGDVERLTALQGELLESALTVLRPGGCLLYTTCSVLPEENAGQVSGFAARHRHEAVPEPFELGGRTCSTCQRLPGTDGGDGFFYALLRRHAPAGTATGDAA